MALDPLSALASQGTTTSVDKLVSMYMAVEQRPINDLKARKGDLAVLSGVFSDLKSKLQALKDLATVLSAGTGSVFSTHTVVSGDAKLVSASATGDAQDGIYSIGVTRLATSTRVQAAALPGGWTVDAEASFTVNDVTITVAAGATLVDIKSAINSAVYDSGRGVQATIIQVDATHSRLVLQGKSTGAANGLTVADTGGTVLSSLGLIDGGGSFAQPVLSTAQDALFTVNGVEVSRASNTGLGDVVGGLSFDLKAETGATAVTLTVAGDTAGMKSKIQDFLNGVNSLVDYLKGKSASTRGSDGNYTRGPLSGYTLYTGLQMELAADLMTPVLGGAAGSPQRLYDLGIQMDAAGHFVINDSSKLEGVLSSNPAGAAAFFGGEAGVATLISNRLAPYLAPTAGAQNSYLQQELDAIAGRQSSLDQRIATLNDRLGAREATLRTQFTQLQSMMVAALRQQQQLSSIFSASSGWGFQGL